MFPQIFTVVFASTHLEAYKTMAMEEEPSLKCSDGETSINALCGKKEKKDRFQFLILKSHDPSSCTKNLEESNALKVKGKIAPNERRVFWSVLASSCFQHSIIQFEMGSQGFSILLVTPVCLHQKEYPYRINCVLSLQIYQFVQVRDYDVVLKCQLKEC